MKTPICEADRPFWTAAVLLDKAVMRRREATVTASSCCARRRVEPSRRHETPHWAPVPAALARKPNLKLFGGGGDYSDGSAADAETTDVARTA